MTTAIHYREGIAGDREGVLSLRSLAFPDDDVEKQQPDFWDWEFANGYAGAGRFFVAEAGGEIVGHFGFVPQHYLAPQLIRGALAVDVMTHPEFRRRGVFSGLSAFAAERLKQEFQLVTAFQIRESVMGGMEAGGWRPVQRVPILLRPLSFRAIAGDFGISLGATPKTGEPAANASIRVLGPGDLAQIDALVASDAIRQKRSGAFLEWRYQHNPHWRYERLGFFEGEMLRAFLIHRDTILRGLRSVAIADAGVARGSERAMRVLLRHVCRAGRSRGRSVAAALISGQHPARRALLRSGFLPGPHRFRLLLQIFDDSLRSLSDKPWSLSWGDTDHL